MINRRSILGAMLATASYPSLSKAKSAKQGASTIKFQMTFDGQTMTAALDGNPSSRELIAMLPLDLKIDDYLNNEKIAYLPRKLTRIKDEPFGNARPGDIAYYAPWGNLVFYHSGYAYSRGLIRLGRFDDGFQPLLTRGEYPLRIEPLTARAIPAQLPHIIPQRDTHMTNRQDLDNTQNSGSGIDRRNLLTMTGAGVAALGAMSIFDTTFAKAQGMSNGADNFYTSDRVTLQKVTFKS